MKTNVDIDPQTLRAAHTFMKKVADQYGASTVILFGSRARRTHHASSDADLAIVLQGEPHSFIDTKLEMDDLAYDVLLETGIRIQPLPVWEVEWANPQNYSNPRLLENIEREGIRL